MLAKRTMTPQGLESGEMKRGSGLLSPCPRRGMLLTMLTMLTNARRSGKVSCPRPIPTISWSLSDLAGLGST